MNCRFCNAENDDDAVFCINCGKRLDGKIKCPSCGTENEGEAKFCKECGHSLLKPASKQVSETKNSESKGKGLRIANLIYKIVAISMVSFVILFAFGACFAPFIMYGKNGMNLFDLIKDLQEFKAMPGDTYGADFYMIGNTLPDILCIIGISISLIGCTTALIWGSVRAILTGMKKEIPDLNKQGLLATFSLLVGMMFSSLIFIGSKASTSLGASNVSLKYGSIVLAAVSIGLAWYFIDHVFRFVLYCFKGMKKKEIIRRAFKFGEAAFLCVILFNICSSFLSFTITQVDWSLASAKSTTSLSIGALFTNLSQAIYYKTLDFEFVFSDSGLVGGYYLAMATLIIFIVILVASVVLIFMRMEAKGEKASLGTAIPLVVMAIVELVLAIVSINVFSKTGGVFEALSASGEEVKKQIGSSIIVFIVFSVLTLALEITWMALNKAVKDERAIETNDL